MKKNTRNSDSLETLLLELREESKPLRSALVYRLSDPSEDDLRTLRAGWEQIPAERRRLLMSRLAETSEASFEVDYTAVALHALSDEDAIVRTNAIAALWEDENAATMHRFVLLLQQDPSPDVRAAAAEALARFVLAGELGKLPEASARQTEDALLEAYISADEPLDVRRRALESLAYSGRTEVPDLIDQARRHDDPSVRTTAIFAMGRSADDRWAPQVIEALDDPEAEMRYEAARAAGELGLASTVTRLIQLAHGADREVKEVAIWSLGEIGGSQAQRALLQLADEEDDDDLLEAIEDAVNTAALGAGELATYLLGIDEDDNERDEEDDTLYDD